MTLDERHPDDGGVLVRGFGAGHDDALKATAQRLADLDACDEDD